VKTHHSKEKTHDKDEDDKDEDEDVDVDDVHENNTEVYSEFVFRPRAWIQVVWLNFQISVWAQIRRGRRRKFRRGIPEPRRAGAQISAAGGDSLMIVSLN